MMKKAFSVFLLCLLLAPPVRVECQEALSRGLFVSVIQDPPVLSSREEIKNLVSFAKKAGIRTLFVQVYRANKAWFPSTVADSGPYESCRKNLSQDPFQFVIKQAHA